ncbi:tetratricopeptide repeat protein [Phenylobacterium sp. LH3H17]|uniref:tetratricopeptide repeat protein n=1 Tax=Phenylobacterium sp. LH3H17 TaxID=2903901 RepID=UPI0020CA1BC8|nr:tetratricopeptide repeat protein [Phenylobacterium sp. LH3H17]UTP40081.1 tetratricopeptide repeat protein [Phenylobacterium sp. LH3H17]
MTEDSTRERSRRTLESARSHFQGDPSLANTVWYGRVLGFRYRIDEAITVFTEGLERFPDSFELLRQRGHRFLSTRRFAEGQADLARAADLIEGMSEWIEPDGIGNELPVPATSIQFNTWYHLALAHYLLREWDAAEAAYRRCLEWVRPEDYDGLTACNDWLYMTLRRKGDDAAADQVLGAIPDDLPDGAFVEGPSYYRRLRMYRGELRPEDLLNPDKGSQVIHDLETIYATQGYGVGNWYLYNGEMDRAREVFEQILQGRSRFAFGYIAAERDLWEMAGGDPGRVTIPA